MNKAMMVSKMKLHEDTGNSLAQFLNIAHSTLSLKINGKADFTQREITLIKERYNLTADEVDGIFFTHQVS